MTAKSIGTRVQNVGKTVTQRQGKMAGLDALRVQCAYMKIVRFMQTSA